MNSIFTILEQKACFDEWSEINSLKTVHIVLYNVNTYFLVNNYSILIQSEVVKKQVSVLLQVAVQHMFRRLVLAVLWT